MNFNRQSSNGGTVNFIRHETINDQKSIACGVSNLPVGLNVDVAWQVEVSNQAAPLEGASAIITV